MEGQVRLGLRYEVYGMGVEWSIAAAERRKPGRGFVQHLTAHNPWFT